MITTNYSCRNPAEYLLLQRRDELARVNTDHPVLHTRDLVRSRGGGYRSAGAIAGRPSVPGQPPCGWQAATLPE
jgi:hypothetical protein